MAITAAQIQAAQAIQHAAAHDTASQVRVVAGPGTGKSFTIEERVCWLLAQGVAPEQVCAVSFTRASALDLRRRVQSYCLQNGQPTVTRVRVSTLHALALRTLRAAGLLTAYPADPLVLDSWELETIFDAEFGNIRGLGKTRCEEIRREHEAFWSTGQWGPPNYIPPNPAISGAERNDFQQFHTPRTQTYSCVLPGIEEGLPLDGLAEELAHPRRPRGLGWLAVQAPRWNRRGPGGRRPRARRPRRRGRCGTRSRAGPSLGRRVEYCCIRRATIRGGRSSRSGLSIVGCCPAPFSAASAVRQSVVRVHWGRRSAGGLRARGFPHQLLGRHRILMCSTLGELNAAGDPEEGRWNGRLCS